MCMKGTGSGPERGQHRQPAGWYPRVRSRGLTKPHSLPLMIVTTIPRDTDSPEVHHVAMVVSDLEEGMTIYSEALGLPWADAWSGPIPVVFEGETQKPDISFTLSREGPPHLELIQSTAHEVWQPTAGLHHIGIWTSDIELAVQNMSAGSFVVEVMSPTADFAYLRTRDGARIELVNSRSQPDFARWLGGGRL